MSSRSPSTSSPHLGRGGGDADQLSIEEIIPLAPAPLPPSWPIQFRARGEFQHVQTSASVSAIAAAVAGPSLVTHPQHEEWGLALDGLPRINTVPAPENQRPGSSMSPSALPPSLDMDPTDASQDRHSLTPPDASIVDCGVHPALQLHHQEEPESGSELDSPPRITFLPIPEVQGPSSLTSPPGPPLVYVDPRGSPKYSSDEEDPYFNSLVDNFVSSTANTCSSALSYDDIDYKAIGQQQCLLYAESALKHYNQDGKNEIKYELVSGITYFETLVEEGCVAHVNFKAKGRQQKEELFFAELRLDRDTLVPTCVVSLEGIEKVGGLRGSRYDKVCLDVLPMDTQHCYSCNRQIKHSKDGHLYETGHIAMSAYYM